MFARHVGPELCVKQPSQNTPCLGTAGVYNRDLGSFSEITITIVPKVIQYSKIGKTEEHHP
jgi:hypothetical protein